MKPSEAFNMGIGSVLYILGFLCYLNMPKIMTPELPPTFLEFIVYIMGILWIFITTLLVAMIIINVFFLIYDWLWEQDEKYDEKIKDK